MHQYDHVGAALDFLDDGAPGRQGPLDRRLLHAKISEASAFGGRIDTHPMKGVDRVRGSELTRPSASTTTTPSTTRGDSSVPTSSPGKGNADSATMAARRSYTWKYVCSNMFATPGVVLTTAEAALR